MRHLLIPLLCFIGFFILFWNVRQWNVPTAKKIGLVTACAGVSAVAAGAAILIFITVFN
jgi:hypothetical protein